jgi:hypothetical protein
MNRISKRSAVTVAALLVATCLHVIVTAAAPAAFQGIFKLSHEVSCGKAVLPAGEYLLRVEYSGPATLVTIGEAKTGKTIAFLVSVASEVNKDGKGESALLIGIRDGQATVHSLKLNQLHTVLIFDPVLAHDRGIELAGRTQAVPLIALKK